MRTAPPVPVPIPVSVAALACAALLAATATACGPGSAGAAAQRTPSASAPAPDPLAGRDPAAVLRSAYEQTESADSKEATFQRTIGTRQIRADLSFEGDGSCWGRVTVFRAGTGEVLMEDGRLSFRGDAGFLKDHFGDAPVKAPDTEDGWFDVRPADPSVAHLLALCKEGYPSRAFPAERTGIHREPDTYQNGKPVAVFTSKGPGGVELIDHVLLEGEPYLVKHWQRGGPDAGSAEYRTVRRSGSPAGGASRAGAAPAVSQAPSTLDG
ncbi:hypothetical protein Slala05_57710 [Streptomyces lavendulae subsp. lavendulae]|nr:hypothetical protein Slala05_57710 [Streptomyces lavendulae subsp. lavendulae]